MRRTDVPAESALVGRDDVRLRLKAALATATTGRADRVVVVGGPGSGRTVVLDEAIQAAGGMTVLTARPVPAEATLAHATLFDLCQPVAHLVDQLPNAQAALVSGVLAMTTPATWSPMAVGTALLALFARAARDAPVLVVVDGLDLADAESVDALLIAARRCHDEAVAIVVTTGPAVASRLEDASFDRIDLLPLGIEDATTVLERHCAFAPDREVRDRLLAVAEGNPLALALLPRALSMPQLKGRWPLPDPLPTARRLEDAVAGELDQVDDAGRLALVTVAASLSGARTSIEAALAALDVPAADTLDRLTRSGHLVDDGGRVRFVRQVTRSVVYRRADAADRRRVHSALAEVLGGELTVDQRAWHLSAAAVGPDSQAADLLEDAATGMRRRGASSSAAAALDRAVALTSAPDVRARRRVVAAESLLAIGETERARIHLECVEVETSDPEVSARALHLRGRVLMSQGSGSAAQALLSDAGRMVRGHEPELSGLMLCEAAIAAVHGRRFDAALELAEEATATAPAGSTAAQFAGLVLGTAAIAAGDTRRGRGLLRTFLDAFDVGDYTGPAAPVFDGVALALIWAERYREARRLLNAVVTERQRTMATGLLASSLSLRALLGQRTGDTVHAYADAVEALRLMEGDDGHAQRASCLTILASVESALGLTDSCLEHAAKALAVIGERRGRSSTLRIGALSAAASAELGRGRSSEAISWLLALGDAAGAVDRGNPGTVMWEPDLVEALVADGRAEEARALLAPFEARALAAGNQRGLGAAARCRGLLAATLADAEEHFARSIEHYGDAANPFGTGRTWMAWGRSLLADGRRDEGVEHLRRALADFEAGGAGAWVARASNLLDEVGASAGRRRPSLGELPNDVAEVALLRAAGFDVDKIASHVLSSRTTVARHLAEATDALGEDPATSRLRPAAAPADEGSASLDEVPAQLGVVAASTQVLVLGEFRVLGADGDRTPPPGLGARLVKLVALAPGASIGVDEAVEWLWPELDPERGRARLRNVLSRLRAASGELVIRSGDALRLVPDAQVDLHRFDELARAALTAAARNAPEAPALAKEALAACAGEVLPDSPYESWAAAPRERARRRLIDLLDLLAVHHRRSGRLDDAVRVVERAIAIDRYDEERYVLAAELRREQGRHGAAMAMLERARSMVRELGLAPSPRLVSVEASLR